jgi:hypothetical protein
MHQRRGGHVLGDAGRRSSGSGACLWHQAFNERPGGGVRKRLQINSMRGMSPLPSGLPTILRLLQCREPGVHAGAAVHERSIIR